MMIGVSQQVSRGFKHQVMHERINKGSMQQVLTIEVKKSYKHTSSAFIRAVEFMCSLLIGIMTYRPGPRGWRSQQGALHLQALQFILSWKEWLRLQELSEYTANRPLSSGMINHKIFKMQVSIHYRKIMKRSAGNPRG
jgi:hypothetical protein